MLAATIGSSLATDPGLEKVSASFDDLDNQLWFGSLEPLVDLMENTPVQQLQQAVVQKHREGSDLRTLTAAAALANALAFGGQDYDGYHTFMELGPALDMASEFGNPAPGQEEARRSLGLTT